MDIEYIPRDDCSRIKSDGWEKFEALAGKKIVITNHTFINNMESEIKERDIFLLLVVYNDEDCDFFDTDKNGELIIPKWAKVKNYIILNEIELNELKMVSTFNLASDLTPTMKILNVNPTVYWYSHSGTGRTKYLDYLTMVNNMLNVERVKIEPVNTPKTTITNKVVLKELDSVIDLSEYGTATSVFKLIGTDGIFETTAILPNLETIKGVGKIKNLAKFLEFAPNLKTINLESKRFGNTCLTL